MLLVKSESTEVKTIESIMSKHLITIDADSSAFEAAKKMSERMVSSIIITDNDKTVGILTERDLIKQVCATDLQASKTPLTSIMSAPLITIDKNSTVEYAADIMIKNKVRHLGVTYSSSSSNHNAQIIGIVSSRDLVRLFIHKLGKNEKVLTNQLINNYYWQEEPVEEINS
jgi:signal-transduction protein with cAMP-binding, CBS, and nucleotidyltransferase domain